MKVVPVLLPDHYLSDSGFTPGREYPVLFQPTENAAVVRNDNGHERVVLLDGSLSAHLMGCHSPVGYFEVA